jgi:long-chain acyl-CoA synthetase
MGEEVKAFLVLKEGQQLNGADFIAWCKERLAANKYPRSVEIRDALPIGNTGKISKLELRKQLNSD